MWTDNITKKLNIEYPIVQAPMFGVTTPEMVASAASVGCLGSLPFGDLPRDKCAELIRATKKLSNLPFSINLFVNEIPKITDDIKRKYANTKQFIERLAKQYRLDVELPNLDELNLQTYHEQIDVIINEKCKIVSFTFGNLDAQTIRKFKENDTVLIGTCNSVSEAKILEQSGIDVICVQGLEAGGHRGTFVTEDIPEIGGLSLLSQVYDSVNIPLIYAGGIYDSKTLLAAKTLGAKGFQIGSLLLGSTESGLKDFEKERLKSVNEQDIVLTKSFSGRYARGIKNTFIEAIENTEYILPYPIQNKLTSELRRISRVNKSSDFVNIWVGQSISKFKALSTAEILKDLISETEQVFLKKINESRKYES